MGDEAPRREGSQRTRDQSRQLAVALATLRADPDHNIRRAAKVAFARCAGYATAESLYCSLRRAWMKEAK